jgi:hypothetical protein
VDATVAIPVCDDIAFRQYVALAMDAPGIDERSWLQKALHYSVEELPCDGGCFRIGFPCLSAGNLPPQGLFRTIALRLKIS